MSVGTIVALLFTGLIAGLILGMWFWDKYLKGVKMEKRRFVLFKYFNKYKFTSEEFYNRRIMDLDECTTIVDCNSAEEAKACLYKWGIISENDVLIDMTGE